VGNGVGEFVGDGATLTNITQTFNLAAGTLGVLEAQKQYSFNVFAKCDVVPAAGTMAIELIDGSNNIIADDAGTNNVGAIVISSLSTSWASRTATFRLPRLLPDTIKLRVRLTVAITAGSSLFLDHMSLGEMTEAYTGGPYLAIHSAATKFLADDFYTVTPTNNAAGDFQQLFERLFDMRTLGQQLPSDSGGGETISDSLVG